MAVKIYRLSDRIPVKIGDVTFKLGSMTAAQKADLAECYTTVNGETVVDHTQAAIKVMKYTVKDIDGVEYATGGGEYKLSFVNGCQAELTDDCVSELMGMEVRNDLIFACTQFAEGVPKQIMDPRTGKKLKGVEMLPPEKGELIKK